MAPSDPLGRLTSAAGAVVGAVGFVYLVGALSLSLRYEGFGLPGQHAAAVTPREVLLAAGLRTLVIWVALGLAIALSLTVREGWLAGVIQQRLMTSWGRVAVVALAIALLFVRVLWPLAVLVGVLATTYATVTWAPASARRVLVTTLAIGLVTVADEADRLSYYVEATCVDEREPAGRSCGLLVGQQDRGFYLGVTERSGAASVLFVPASRVASASSRKQLSRVNERAGRDRRKRIVSRVTDLRVR
jgi:hypothetical protein